jgi:myo-inositol 2-dehydrogenase / D-chiro-inositol 1-dehydrogenase
VTTRIGIAGCGTIAQAHSRSLKAIIKGGLVDAAVVATHDLDRPRAEAFARAHGADVALDADALLAGIDAVWVCTPTSSHRELVEAAARQGVAVFCEKPLAPTLADAEALTRAVAVAGVPAQVGLVLRTAPVFGALRATVTSGRLGRAMAVGFRDDQFFPIQGHYRSTWRSDVSVAGAGTLLEHSIHDLDILRYCLGEVTEVTARTANYAGHEGIEDVAVALLTFASGATASLISVWHDVLTRPSLRRIEVFCERGLVWFDDDFAGPLHVETTAGAEVRPCLPPAWVADLPWPDDRIELAVSQYAEADRAFLDALAAGRAPQPGLEEGLIAHRLADAVYRSAREGRTVAIALLST